MSDVPRSLPTARELFESADALMRRNRRTGAAPLPPPEGYAAFATLNEETQTLSAGIEAEREAELAKELSRIESGVSSEAVSPLTPEFSQPSPIAAVLEESTLPDIGVVAETLAPITEVVAIEEESESQKAPEEPSALSWATEGSIEGTEVWAESDFSMEGWLEEMLSPEGVVPLTESASLTAPDAALLQSAEVEESMPEMSEPAMIEREKKEQTEKQAVEMLPENTPESTSPQMEDDLLLWEFATPPHVAAPEAEAIAELVFVNEEEESPDKEPLSLIPSFSEAISFLSAPEALASPPQDSSAYTTVLPTMVFDDMEAEEEHPVAEAMPEILPEFPSEEPAFFEEMDWLSAEEVKEVSIAFDAEAASPMEEALSLLPDTEMPEETSEAGETAAENWLPEPAAGLWYLVEAEEELEEEELEEDELEEEEPEEEELEEEELEEEELEEAELEEAELEEEELEEAELEEEELEEEELEEEELEEAELEEAELEEAELEEEELEEEELEEAELAAAEVEENAVEEAALFETLLTLEELQEAEEAAIKAWASDAEEDDAQPFVEPEILGPVAKALIETEKNFGVDVIVAEEKAPEIPAAVFETADVASAASEKVFEKAPELPPTPESSAPAQLKIERASLISAATLLSERQRQNGEAKPSSVRYSAAQLLTEYKQQNPQMQNVKAIFAVPRSAKVASSSGLPLSLVDEHDSLSTFNEPRQKSAKQAGRVSPSAGVRPPKDSPLELGLESLLGARSARSTVEGVTLDDDGYPVLTDVVDESELPMLGKA
ncbi:MAG: hypothetical protein LBI16_03090 [Burkholderiales bacterium]|nr:hypothetical protein [Burkholderiales bacterium]